MASEKQSSEREISKEPFKSPKHLFGENFPIGSTIKINQRAKPPSPEKPKNVFEKEGISRSQLRRILEKSYDPMIPINRNERVGLEKEMPRSRYGESISEKDAKNHLKNLKKEEYLLPHTKDKVKIREKIKIFWKLLNKK